MCYMDYVFIAECSAQPDCQQPDDSSQLFTALKTTTHLEGQEGLRKVENTHTILTQ